MHAHIRKQCKVSTQHGHCILTPALAHVYSMNVRPLEPPGIFSAPDTFRSCLSELSSLSTTSRATQVLKRRQPASVPSLPYLGIEQPERL